ncbi:MAG: DNA polymerase III subunit chi [Candidatus Protistobacter heckmanni]|nr:DNA polymerase III subunit chi [Candidatus Protistobacter heckmanni]
MTRIDFHSNVPHKLQYVCRIARKSVRSGARLVIQAPGPVLEELDTLMWTFSHLDFVPHCALHSPLAPQTPVLLAADFEEAPHYQVLVNLGDAPPPLFARFDRLLEIVGADEEDKHAGRERYKFYRERGYALQLFDQAGKSE